MSHSVFHSVTSGFSDAFLKQPVFGRHGLAETGLFDDDRLAEMIESHPASLTDMHAPRGLSRDGASFPVATRGGRSGRELLDAVLEGRLWINLRQVFSRYDNYRGLLDELTGGLKAATPHFRPRKCSAGLLISSPSAAVPYHCDKTDVVLWHVRGRKRLILYPPHAPYLKPEDYERMIFELDNDDLPYDASLEAGAQSFDLTPGDFMTWPLHSPHRVENLEGLNVSVTMEYTSWRSAAVNGAYAFNGITRRAFGWKPEAPQVGGWLANIPKFLVAGLYRRLRPV